MSWWRKLLGWSGEDEPRDPRHNHGQPSPTTPEQEFEIARKVFERDGNPQHAIHHLAEALATDPTDPARLQLLDEILASVDVPPENLVDDSDRGYYAAEAIRAYALHRAGRTTEAIELLLAIARAKPDARFLEAWTLEWLEDEQTLQSTPADLLGYLAGVVVVQYPEHNELRSQPRRWLERLVAVLNRFRAARTEDVHLRTWRAALLRKLGRFDEALAEATKLYQDQPGWQTAVAVANVERHRGDLERAVEEFQRALLHDPEDVSARNDIADLYLERDDWPNALRWYEEVLEREKNHTWALPSAHFCRWKRTQDEQWLEQLGILTEGPQPNARAAELLNTLRPYLGFLPEPSDASANILRQVADAIRQDPNKGPSGELTLTVSHLEAPSNRIAFNLQIQALGGDCRLIVHSEHVPRPDPRQPLAPVEYLLWEYNGDDPRPALPPPSAEIADQVATLASRRYNYWVNWNEAGVAAERLDQERIDELLAAMVHPPAIRGEVSALAWVPRVQLVAAQMIAQIDSGWQGSLRRRVLLDVARGPRDWTTEAAIIALAQLAQAENQPALSLEVRQLFQQLRDARPNQGDCGYMHALLSNWLYLPNVPEQERQKVGKQLQQLSRP